MSEANYVRIGMVGAGYACNRHCANLMQLKEVQIAGFCDVVPRRAHAMASRYGGNGYTDIEEMLDRESLDGLFVCTPPSVRLQIVRAAARRGVHVFVEKPIALSVRDAVAMVNIAKQSKVKLHVGYAYRHHDVTLELKRQIDSGKLGTLSLIIGEYWSGIPGPAWWRSKEHGGGQLVEQASHIYDLVRFLVGDVEAVSGVLDYSIHARDSNFEVEDSAAALLRIKTGIVGCIVNTCNSPFEDTNFVEVRIVGSEGTAVIRPRIAELIVYRPSTNTAKDLFWEDNPRKEHMNHSKNVGYQKECKHFIDTIVNDEEPLVKGDDAILTLATCLAVHKSFEQAKWITVESCLDQDLAPSELASDD